MENEDLFRNIRSSQGTYSGRAHLAEMIALLGPPPMKLIEQESRWGNVKWKYAVQNADGKICHNTHEYYGGPFFDSEGELPRSWQSNWLHPRINQNTDFSSSGAFMHKDLIPSWVRLEDTVRSLGGENKRLFLNFARKMLQWLPEDRKSAKELLEDPWLTPLPG